jgi:hypothetical protein
MAAGKPVLVKANSKLLLYSKVSNHEDGSCNVFRNAGKPSTF